jgi:hypothetical protein
VKILDEYLAFDGVAVGDGFVRRSSFWAAVVDARNVSGRDKYTGEVVRPSGTLAWIGAVAWLCFIDQVGSALKRTDLDSTTKKRWNKGGRAEQHFRRAVVQFVPQVEDDDIGALWALRCSLAHDYSLCNYVPERPDLTHQFALIAEGNDDFQGLVRRDETTLVNLWRLGDLGEHVRASVEVAHADGCLRPAIHHAEFQRRYFMLEGRGVSW